MIYVEANFLMQKVGIIFKNQNNCVKEWGLIKSLKKKKKTNENFQ